MPVGGAASIVGRGPTSAWRTPRLRMLDRERAARGPPARGTRRQAEGRARRRGPHRRPILHPFEDFDDRVPSSTSTRWRHDRRAQRARPAPATTPVRWLGRARRRQPRADGPRPDATRCRCRPPRADFALSDIVLADERAARSSAAYPPDQPERASRTRSAPSKPTPAQRRCVSASTSRLSVLFQVINPAADDDRQARRRGERSPSRGWPAAREERVGALPRAAPQRRHPAGRLRRRQGAPAVRARCRRRWPRFARGRYRLTVTATDRVSGRQTTRDGDVRRRRHAAQPAARSAGARARRSAATPS